jgi:ribonuclease HII
MEENENKEKEVMTKYKNKLMPYQTEGVIEVGIDEAGRGCLLGRVYVAGVILPNNILELCEEEDIIIKDSKKMNKKNKDRARKFIEKNAIDYSIVYKDNDYIDKYNIFEATHTSMHEVISNLNIKPEKILVDGNYFRRYWDDTYEEIEHECVVEGDNKYMSIAAASILAKTYKDEYIENIVKEYPELGRYDLLNNSGYGTQNHIEAIKIFGLSKFHRKTFGICKNYK